MIIIQLGGNNIVDGPQKDLLEMICSDLQYVQFTFQDTDIVWSDILPRRIWQYAEHDPITLKSLNDKHKRINRGGRLIMREYIKGHSIMHDIDLETNGFFLLDGTHMTPIAKWYSPQYIPGGCSGISKGSIS